MQAPHLCPCCIPHPASLSFHFWEMGTRARALFTSGSGRILCLVEFEGETVLHPMVTHGRQPLSSRQTAPGGGSLQLPTRLSPHWPPTACLFISSSCIDRASGGGFMLSEVLGAAV